MSEVRFVFGFFCMCCVVFCRCCLWIIVVGERFM